MVGGKGKTGRKVAFLAVFWPLPGVPWAGKPNDGFLRLKMGRFGPFWAQNERENFWQPSLESGTPDSTRSSQG